MVHDGRLVAGPGKFKFKCNLLKAAIHEALQNGLTGFCGSGGQLLGCRTESSFSDAELKALATCQNRLARRLLAAHRKIWSILTKEEVNRKLGIVPIAMELRQRRLDWAKKIPGQVVIVHCESSS